MGANSIPLQCALEGASDVEARPEGPSAGRPGLVRPSSFSTSLGYLNYM